MTALPKKMTTIESLIDNHHAAQPNDLRTHLGASGLGHKCDRWIWLSFRWAVQEKFPGRIRRLFRRGHNEEASIVADLKAIGIDIHHTGDDQQFVRFGSHVSGSLDGIIESGVLGAEKTRHIAEFKTHSVKSFNEVERGGVKKTKPMHWAQMQIYMAGMEIDRALYVAVCKDNDRLYTERVEYDEDAAIAFIERGRRIALAERMPPPISTDPSWYECKFCAAYSFCHETQLTKEVNCRTCAHSTPETDSTWSCARWEAKDIPGEFQKTGCDGHVLHPDLVPWPIKDSTNAFEAIYEIEGVDVRNGEADAFTFSSSEIIANPGGCTAALTGKVRAAFPGAKVVG